LFKEGNPEHSYNWQTCGFQIPGEIEVLEELVLREEKMENLARKREPNATTTTQPILGKERGTGGSNVPFLVSFNPDFRPFLGEKTRITML